MASGYDLEVTVESAHGLKNVNWRHGPLRPYAVLWVDPNNKRSTMVDDEGGTFPVWGQTFVLPFTPVVIEDATLYIDVVHAGSEQDTKPLIGSARLKVRDVLDEADFGETRWRSLQLKRPSGRPHGKVEVEVCVWEPRYRPPNHYGAPPYWVPPAYGYPCAPPAGGYAYVTNNPQLLEYGYDGELAAAYGQEEEEEEKSNLEGIGKVFAVGAVVGALGGLVLAGWLGSKIVDGDGGAWVQCGSGCYNSRPEPILVGYVLHETRNPPRAEYSVRVWVVALFVLLCFALFLARV
ncbi:uncharacterized protein LOC115690921 [Syzygium oleosum]|uniref:uncharacterized protein LOC115690921 n=1 Tax=Syzygium oleosum TaxID=219896 RepID=UPI0024B98804|nr:uncharacterized protein LOC115690921 [Syzygium oleosum]